MAQKKKECIIRDIRTHVERGETTVHLRFVSVFFQTFVVVVVVPLLPLLHLDLPPLPLPPPPPTVFAPYQFGNLPQISLDRTKGALEISVVQDSIER